MAAGRSGEGSIVLLRISGDRPAQEYSVPGVSADNIRTNFCLRANKKMFGVFRVHLNLLVIVM